MLFSSLYSSSEKTDDLSLQPLTVTFQDIHAGLEHFQKGGTLSTDLTDAIGKEVSIRGFVYQAKDGHMILSAEPDLKSCCVGGSGKRLEQVALINLSPDSVSSNALDLIGTLHFDAHHDHPLVLDVSAIQHRSSGSLWIYVILAFSLFCMACACLWHGHMRIKLRTRTNITTEITEGTEKLEN